MIIIFDRNFNQLISGMEENYEVSLTSDGSGEIQVTMDKEFSLPNNYFFILVKDETLQYISVGFGEINKIETEDPYKIISAKEVTNRYTSWVGMVGGSINPAPPTITNLSFPFISPYFSSTNKTVVKDAWSISSWSLARKAPSEGGTSYGTNGTVTIDDYVGKTPYIYTFNGTNMVARIGSANPKKIFLPFSVVTENTIVNDDEVEEKLIYSIDTAKYYLCTRTGTNISVNQVTSSTKIKTTEDFTVFETLTGNTDSIIGLFNEKDVGNIEIEAQKKRFFQDYNNYSFVPGNEFIIVDIVDHNYYEHSLFLQNIEFSKTGSTCTVNFGNTSNKITNKIVKI